MGRAPSRVATPCMSSRQAGEGASRRTLVTTMCTMHLPAIRAIALRSAAIVVLSTAPLCSAELVVRDLTVSLELLPTGFSYTLDNAAGTRSGDDAFSSGYGVALGGRYSLSGPGDSTGFILGGEITAGSYAYQGGGSMSTYGARLLGGYGWAFGDRWSINALIDAGAGAANLELTGKAAFDHYAASGLYYSYAARVGLAFAATESLLLAAEAGYRGISSSLAAGGTTITLSGTGLCAGVGIWYRFSNSPSTLE